MYLAPVVPTGSRTGGTLFSLVPDPMAAESVETKPAMQGEESYSHDRMGLYARVRAMYQNVVWCIYKALARALADDLPLCLSSVCYDTDRLRKCFFQITKTEWMWILGPFRIS
jgi:hypothetical protein